MKIDTVKSKEAWTVLRRPNRIFFQIKAQGPDGEYNKTLNEAQFTEYCRNERLFGQFEKSGETETCYLYDKERRQLALFA